jgi:hypothetical protein
MNEESPVGALLTSNPSRDELFRLLTEEIHDISDAEKLKGWTPWVILASMVSGLWLLAQDLFTGNHSKRASVATFLLVTVILHIARLVQRQLDSISEDPSGRASFFFLHSDISAFSLLTLSAWTAGIAYAAVRLSQVAPPNQFLFAGELFYSAMAIMTLSMMIPVVARLPIPLSRRGPQPLHLAVGSTIIVAVLVAFVGGVIKGGFMHNLTIVDIRIGTVAALEVLGIIVLSGKIGEKTDSREALSEIRRDLVLGGISTEAGSHRARTILRGMWLSDIVMKDMNALLKLISKARGEYEDALGKVKTFKTVMKLANADEGRQVARLTLSNMLDTLEAHELRICDVVKQYHRLLGSLQLRLQVVTKIYSNAEGDSRRLIAEIRTAQAPVDLLQKQFVADCLDLQEVWNLKYPAEQRDRKPFAQLWKKSIDKSTRRLWS